MVTLLFGRIVGTVFDMTVRQPILILRRGQVLAHATHLGKYGVVCVCMYLAYKALQNPTLNLKPSGLRTPSRLGDHAPESVEEIKALIIELGNRMADIEADSQTERRKFDGDLRKVQDVIKRVGKLETRVDKEVVRAQEDTRISTFKGIESLQREIRDLRSQQSELAKATPKVDGAGKEEDRAKFRDIEERIGFLEGGLKDAVDLANNAAKAGSLAAAAVQAANSATGSSWWSKTSSESVSSVMIKSTDGRDVTPLLNALIDQRVGKDGLARVDFALNSGGGGVIPSLTSNTLEIRSSYFWGLLSGPVLHARSPVVALHHETSLGYCWPFAGSQGHLGVKLADRVFVEDITIDHVPREVAHDMRPAPRHMDVWAVVEGADNLKKYQEYLAQKEQKRRDAEEEGSPVPIEPAYPLLLKNAPYVRIASFMYDINAPSNIQTFSVFDDVRVLNMDFGIVVLNINSNWGSKEFTCLYRFRVHGTRAAELPAPDA